MKHWNILFALISACFLASCGQKQDSPKDASTGNFLQNLGDKASEAAQKASEAASEAADSVADSADKAWKETERKAGNITKQSKQKLEDAANK